MDDNDNDDTLGPEKIKALSQHNLILHVGRSKSKTDTSSAALQFLISTSCCGLLPLRSLG